MWVYWCVYANWHKYTHGTDGVLGCEPRVRDETPGGPEESSWTKSRHFYICICVQSTHVYVYASVYVYARRRDEILGPTSFFFNMLFLSKKKSKRCEHKPPIISNLK